MDTSQAQEDAPPDAKEIAELHQWIQEGQPILVRIAQARLREAGLPVPEPPRSAPPPTEPAQPAQPATSCATAGPREQEGAETTAQESRETGQDRPGTPRDDPDGESIQEPARAQPEPSQAPSPRRGDPTPLGGLVATSWAALMARAQGQDQAPRGPKYRTLVAEEQLRAYTETGEACYLEAALDSLSAHWRDWKKETREHWAGCLAELRSGLVTVDEILGLIADSERKGITHRARHFSHHLGEVLAEKRGRAQKRAPGPVLAGRPGGARLSDGYRP